VDGRGASRRVADEVVEAIRARGGRAVANADSVADFAAAERIVETAVREFGAIDILVNNAGILRDRMIFNMSEEEWDAVIAVHLKGTFNCTRHATRRMREQRRGRIISISSTSGVYGHTGQANYGAAKDGSAGRSRACRAYARGPCGKTATVATEETDHDLRTVDRSGAARPPLSVRRWSEAGPAARGADEADAAAGPVRAVHRRGRGARRDRSDP